ncbi:hypothetical protein ACQEWB_11210 [Streptomyces sp. CA-249302]|uniref:hypothetical protein n=1 Tax=Streptomyces sp. CA-249302 TaxID=3240058 RepID=UPI003D8F4384
MPPALAVPHQARPAPYGDRFTAHAGADHTCVFVPARAVRHSGALLVAQPCWTDAAWTAQVVAVDHLGRITPDRRPLGNGVPGRPPEHPSAEKVLAHPR